MSGERMSRWREHAAGFSPILKLVTLAAAYVETQAGSRYYGLAANQAWRLRAAYDRALGDADALLLPTPPMVGHSSMKRFLLSLADTRLPPNMQTEITAPATGIETIDPTDVVIEKRGARSARTVKLIPIAPIDSVNRQKLDSGLNDRLSLRARTASSTITRDTDTSGR